MRHAYVLMSSTESEFEEEGKRDRGSGTINKQELDEGETIHRMKSPKANGQGAVEVTMELTRGITENGKSVRKTKKVHQERKSVQDPQASVEPKKK